MDRFNLLNMQDKLNRILENGKPGKTTVITIDNFTMNESVLPLLELYLNESLTIQDGIPVELGKKIKLILIMDEMDMQKYRQQELLVRYFKNFRISSRKTY